MPLRRCEALSVLRRRTSRLRRRAAGVSLGVPTNIGNVERPACQECFKCTFSTSTWCTRTYSYRSYSTGASSDYRALLPPFVSQKLVFVLASLLSFTVSGMPRRLRYVPVLQSYHNRYQVYSSTRHGVLEQAASNKIRCFFIAGDLEIFCLKLSINNQIVGLVHKNRITRRCLMYHAACRLFCRVEFQPFKQLYSQLTLFNCL